MAYDPNRPPWDQDYSPAKPTTPPAPTTGTTDASTGRTWYEPQQSVTDYLRAAPTEAGLSGVVSRGGLGVVQSFLGPAEWAAKETGLSKYVPESVKGPARLVQKAAETPEGTVGGIVGSFKNPLFKAIDIAAGPIQAGADIAAPYVESAIGSGGTAIRALGRIARGIIAGGAGGAVAQPGDTARGAEGGAAVGGLLGIPGAAAALHGAENVQQLLGPFMSHVPIVSDLARGLKAAGEAGFNRVWYGHALSPIGGAAPLTAGRDALNNVSRQIGAAIDRATSGMTLTLDPGGRVTTALSDAVTRAGRRLLDTGARREFVDTITSHVLDPLSRLKGFTSDQLQSVQSNLQAVIRDIPGETDTQRALKSALEDFRVTLFSNATGGDQALWRRARLAWSRFATLRDAAHGSRTGVASPEDLANAIEARHTTEYGTGRAPDQAVADTASQALLTPKRAAQRAIAGLPQTQPGDVAARAGAASNQVGQPPGLTSAGQPPTYQSVVPGL